LARFVGLSWRISLFSIMRLAGQAATYTDVCECREDWSASAYAELLSGDFIQPLVNLSTIDRQSRRLIHSAVETVARLLNQYDNATEASLGNPRCSPRMASNVDRLRNKQ
jgi:hypothetical protein